MTSEALISRLEVVKPRGQGRWQARCPAHTDKFPSLAIRELDDGRVLVHCFAGCDTHSILSALTLDMSDLYPAKPITPYEKGERRPFPAIDVLRCIAFEALVVATAGAALLRGHPPFSLADRERLMLAVSRIQAALSAGGLLHG